MGIAFVDAARLAKANKVAYDALIQRHEELLFACADETAAQERARQDVYNDTLVPFRDIFRAIKNVDLAQLEAMEELPVALRPSAEVERVRVSAVGAISVLIGGVAGGAAVGAGTFAAVGALATASTGATISSLSGAAATSATLAWLGGGSIAAGGGGVALGSAVLTGLVAAPVLLGLVTFVELKGRQQRRQQLEAARELRTATAELEVQEAKVLATISQGAEVRSVARDLSYELEDRLIDLGRLVNRSNDYETYTAAERRLVAQAANLATTIVCVLRTRFFDEHGSIPKLSSAVVIDARERLDAVRTS